MLADALENSLQRMYRTRACGGSGQSLATSFQQPRAAKRTLSTLIYIRGDFRARRLVTVPAREREGESRGEGKTCRLLDDDGYFL